MPLLHMVPVSHTECQPCAIETFMRMLDYNNPPLKYDLSTKVVGAHLGGRCILYSFRVFIGRN